MGGFYLFKSGEPQHPLSRQDVVELVRTGDLVPPTEDEIRGWSQGDGLSKTLAIAQTLWFVVQCVARRIEGLPITQLELMTLAYTTITIAMLRCVVAQAAERRRLCPRRCDVVARNRTNTRISVVLAS
ncbi:hypothetical protein BV25DRAFT_1825331 [Artomyces pyxidatus]|uniref:Uncharacterized protein n=1 Tax=Artomyces pyxidatus TaxID=48021 RepID=A0ACB8T3Q5_9AGAM|nr:hypothetical protein BV25DRAFT_1825331 [Artomyces pyxidatus]